eukprot:10821755-Alexandrium_andersonii.AAC.1
MSASLVGSEMCIRDRTSSGHRQTSSRNRPQDSPKPPLGAGGLFEVLADCCLLYTSDAADDM